MFSILLRKIKISIESLVHEIHDYSILHSSIYKESEVHILSSGKLSVNHRCPGPFCSISSTFPLVHFDASLQHVISCQPALRLPTTLPCTLRCLMFPEATTNGSSRKKPFNSLKYLTVLTSGGPFDSVFLILSYNFLLNITSFKSLKN